jgi:hypothetical protein
MAFVAITLFLSFFLAVLELELRAYTSSHHPFFVKGFFKIGSLELLGLLLNLKPPDLCLSS